MPCSSSRARSRSRRDSGEAGSPSRLSRLAEQLGWGIRQAHPVAVERDCLRNAANSFFYADPSCCRRTAPATQLSSEPHSFSRVFTAAFLEIITGMFLSHAKRDEAVLLATAHDAGKLLVNGIKASPVVPSYYSQVAAHMLDVDLAHFGGRYRNALKSGFVRHGVLSLKAATSPPPPQEPRAARRAFAEIAPGVEDTPLTRIALPAADAGLAEDLLVYMPHRTRNDSPSPAPRLISAAPNDPVTTRRLPRSWRTSSAAAASTSAITPTPKRQCSFPAPARRTRSTVRMVLVLNQNATPTAASPHRARLDR